MTFITFTTNEGNLIAGEVKGETYSGGDYMKNIQEMWVVESINGDNYTPAKENVTPITWEEYKIHMELLGCEL